VLVGPLCTLYSKLTMHSVYEKDGQSRSVCELEALAIGPDLARGTAVFRRSPRAAEDGGGGGTEAVAAAESELAGAGV